jgi:5-methyltetrahydropteroyltriglutamate--homocysteine methyltransferase
MMFETSIAGSLPKPAWLAETNKLWPAWKLSGDVLPVRFGLARASVE